MEDNSTSILEKPIKITLVGWSAAGKTAMVNRLIDDRFDGFIPATIGVEYRLVYDITSSSSFEDAKKWYKEVQESVMDDKTITVLVGNKTDQDQSKRQISVEQGELLAQRQGSYFVEISAKSGIGVKETFTRLAELVMHARKEEREAQALIERSRGDGSAGADDPLSPAATTGGGPGLVLAQTVDYMRQRIQGLVGPALLQPKASGSSITDKEEAPAITFQDRSLWLVPELEIKSWEKRKHAVHEDALFRVVVVGDSLAGKSALESRRQVSKEEGEALAKEWSCPFLEASAKLDINVTECFYMLTEMMAQSWFLQNAPYGDGAGDDPQDGGGEAQQGIFSKAFDFDVKGAVQNVLARFGS
ncbi:hypothetical protein CVT24_002957 [Panaeolus cyanescens]|uniref:Uncharacterized protein n=1 Tax=Panaeolus cyanescens TaxID=181874 RepID=A0A409VPC1_9AGAR|nr:hypothetical protein CVT24_002957 [Panaeolus cyanescens]